MVSINKLEQAKTFGIEIKKNAIPIYLRIALLLISYIHSFIHGWQMMSASIKKKSKKSSISIR